MAGTIIAQTLIDKVTGALLNDAAKVRFTQAEALAFLCEGQRVIAAINPSSCSDAVVFTCAAGARQRIPATYHALLRVEFNADSSGNATRAITPVKRETLDVPNPNWRALPPVGQARHVLAENDAPDIFDLYPPVVAGTKVVIRVAKIPADIAANDSIALEDTYETPLMNYMLSRLYQKNAVFGDNADRATAYYQAMMAFLGVKAGVDDANQVEQKSRSG